jgi:hypothetical protein
MRCMKPDMRWLVKVKSTLQPDEPPLCPRLVDMGLKKTFTPWGWKHYFYHRGTEVVYYIDKNR